MTNLPVRWWVGGGGGGGGGRGGGGVRGGVILRNVEMILKWGLIPLMD